METGEAYHMRDELFKAIQDVEVVPDAEPVDWREVRLVLENVIRALPGGMQELPICEVFPDGFARFVWEDRKLEISYDWITDRGSFRNVTIYKWWDEVQVSAIELGWDPKEDKPPSFLVDYIYNMRSPDNAK